VLGGSEDRNEPAGQQVICLAMFEPRLRAMHRAIAVGVFLLVTVAGAGADRAPTDEERIAPLVAAQGCWGGVIKFVVTERKFEVHESVCGDGRYIIWNSMPVSS
jgi:hypothetical protein